MEKPPEKWERKADVRRGLREGISMLFLRRREPLETQFQVPVFLLSVKSTDKNGMLFVVLEKKMLQMKSESRVAWRGRKPLSERINVVFLSTNVALSFMGVTFKPLFLLFVYIVILRIFQKNLVNWKIGKNIADPPPPFFFETDCILFNLKITAEYLSP